MSADGGSHTVPVGLGARAYTVHIGAGLLQRAGELIAPFAPSRRAFVVTDENVAALYLHRLEDAMGRVGIACINTVLPAGERTKSFAGLERLCGALIEAGIERRDLVIAFGGGVIGDLAGLAAALVKRGVDFVQIPTTLLAQVDSSVGGKTAIDTAQGKNMVGLFYQPRLVLADTGLLESLSEREFRAGYAEVVKYGLIDRPDFFAWCEAEHGRLARFDADALDRAVAVSVAAKARIVSADETEQGRRALLNLGHTFAHALEAHAGYDGALLHGEAVAAGLRLAFDHSAALGLCPHEDAVRVRAHLEAAGFVVDLRRLPGAPFDVQRLLASMAADKKAEGGLTLVLARRIGEAFVQKRADAEALARFLAQEVA